jgi:FtsH-binding integral membrane protein
MENDLNQFWRGVYNWMAIGLLLTAGSAYGVASSASLSDWLYNNSLAFYGIMILELFLVIYLSARVQKMSAATATGAFLGYSVLNGITLSLIFLEYTTSSIVSTLIVAAITFGLMALYGVKTKKNLTGFGRFAFMALIGLIVASLVNVFLKNSGFDLIISFIGILVFLGLTAYDTQKIQQYYFALQGADEETKTKSAIIGALTLYLDFINIFLYLLRFFGKRRD